MKGVDDPTPKSMGSAIPDYSYDTEHRGSAKMVALVSATKRTAAQAHKSDSLMG
jgi:hypothetical protein